MQTEQILEQIEMLDLPENRDSFRLFKYTSETKSIYYGIDFDSNLVFVLPSLFPKMKQKTQHTQKLLLNSNAKCKVQFNEIESEITAHILTCRSSLKDEKIAFIRLTEAFNKYFDSDNPYVINELFSALVNLFSLQEKSSEKELQGLYGELYLIYFFDCHGIHLWEYWQKKEKENFDFSLSQFKRIEVKSTRRAERIHHFRHEQLLSDLYDIIIASLLLREDDAGLSLHSLITKVRHIAAEDYKTLLYIDRFIKNVPENELESIKYDEVYCNDHIKFFPARDVPKFEDSQPDGVTHTEYDSDLSAATAYSLSEMLVWIKEGVEN